MTILKSKAGFSLVEVLVAVAITSIVAAMIATMMSHMGNVASFYSTKEDYDSIYRAAQLLLLNENTCKYALRNASGGIAAFNPTGTPAVQKIDAIFMANPASPTTGSNLIKVNEKYSTRLNIRDIYLEEHAHGSGPFTSLLPDAAGNPVAYNSYIVDLKIVADNLSGGAPIAVKPVPLTIILDSSRNIIDCFAQSSSAAICSVLHAVWNPTTGKCDLPTCPPSTPPPPCPSPGVPGETCANPNWFLAFTTAGVPTCQCVQTCTGPQGATGATGAPGATVPVYTY